MLPKLSMSQETYLETIAELQKRFGAVRTSDLADTMGCKRSSVTVALQRLAEKGLIHYEAYRPVTLTPKGHKAIDKLSRMHGIIEDFLENFICLPAEFAREEACRLEHSMSKITIEHIKKFMDSLRHNNPELKGEDVAEAFASILKK